MNPQCSLNLLHITNEHERVHQPGPSPSSQKPRVFSCSSCVKAFAKRSQLERHNRTHTGTPARRHPSVTPCVHSQSLRYLAMKCQMQDMCLSQEDPAHQVTTELDLEVVPEASGDWHHGTLSSGLKGKGRRGLEERPPRAPLQGLRLQGPVVLITGGVGGGPAPRHRLRDLSVSAAAPRAFDPSSGEVSGSMNRLPPPCWRQRGLHSAKETKCSWETSEAHGEEEERRIYLQYHDGFVHGTGNEHVVWGLLQRKK
ncbi:Zinc finger protein 236 [Liparis tanakae]|uniref:Zinc finger protein 236 n=1 Tax=Liparis tanakae TaxID=230148 RepID=A0A4Z2FNZ0_9TELE|nr:Zinc finger protein 236 [Liparis tanakae]